MDDLPSLPSIPGIPSALSNIGPISQPNPLTGPALQTAPSNLESFLDVINKPGAMERQAAINLINDAPVTQGLGDIAGWDDNKPMLENLGNLFTASNAYQPTGGDVLQALRGGEEPTTWYGKTAQGVLGFAMDMFNPADPLNWIGLGELTKTGEALEHAGEAVPLIKGLMEGNRSLLSFTPPLVSGMLGGPSSALAHIPDPVSQAAGGVMKSLTDAAMTLPGAQTLVDAFKPVSGMMGDYLNKVAAGAKTIFKSVGTSGASQLGELGDKAISRTMQDIALEVGDGWLERNNPQMAQFYKQQGYNAQKPADALNIAHKEVARFMDRHIAENQVLRGPGYFKEPSSYEWLKNNPVPTEGPIHPSAIKVGQAYENVRENLLRLSQTVGLPTKEFAGAPSILSGESKQRMAQLGIDPEQGGKVLGDLTRNQTMAMSKDPVMSAQLWKNMLGTAPLEKNPSLMDALRQVHPAAANVMDDDMLKTVVGQAKGEATDISTASVLGDILDNDKLARPSMASWDGSGVNGVVEIKVPDKFQGVIKKNKNWEIVSGPKVTGEVAHYPKSIWVPANEAKHIQEFMGMLSDSEKMNRAIGSFEGSWRSLQGAYKKATLLTPLGGLHTAFRDHIGNHFQSWMAGAWSAMGNAVAGKLALALRRAGDNPEKFAEEVEKLSHEVVHGVNLGEALRAMKESNVFEESFTHSMFGTDKFNTLEKAMGMKAISGLRQLSEDFSRIQHYMTRRFQGWKHEGALHDVRKILYDYTHLSPAVRTMQNFMPWAAWSANNIPAMFAGAFRRPGRANAFYHAKQNIEALQTNKPDERALDEYVKGDPHIRLWQDSKTGKWTYIRLKGFLPIADLEDITSMEKFGNFMMSSLTPYLKTPLENEFNQSTFFKTAGDQGAPIENFPGEKAPFLGMDLSRKTINLLRNIRPLNEINRMIPAGGKPVLGPAEFGLSSAGVNLVPVDMARSVAHARLAYMKQLGNLKSSRKYIVSNGQSTSQIDSLMAQLGANSYQPRP